MPAHPIPNDNTAFVIMLPDLEEAGARFVEQSRTAYDHLHGRVAPHVTLVFPQALSGVAELRGFVDAVFEDARALPVVFDRLTVKHEPGESYVFVLPSDQVAIARITELHERLYRLGDLVRTLRATTFTPHMTIGRFAASEMAEAAYARCLETFQPHPFNADRGGRRQL